MQWLRDFTDIIDLIRGSLEENTVAFPPQKKPQPVNPAEESSQPHLGGLSVELLRPKVGLISWKIFDVIEKKNFLRCSVRV